MAGKILPAPHTTPESLDLNRIFAEAMGAGTTDAVMEVSSHALAQHRAYGIYFDVSVFTNLTRDHLDYHVTMEEYFAAKQLLFTGDGARPPRAAVINVDDESGRQLTGISKKVSQEVLTYGLMQGDFRAAKLEITPQGTKFDLISPARTIPISSPNRTSECVQHSGSRGRGPCGRMQIGRYCQWHCVAGARPGVLNVWIAGSRLQ